MLVHYGHWVDQIPSPLELCIVETALTHLEVWTAQMHDEVKAPLDPPVEESLGASARAEEGERVLQDDSRPYSCFSQ